MIQIADRRVALLDANVLFPFRKRDILWRFHHAGLFRARWTERILDEWTLNLLEQKPHPERSVRSQRHAMHEHFAEALVTGYEPLIGTLELPDADDRHVLAAAIRCGAQYIVTDNLADFPAEVLARFDIEAIDADGFLSRTFDLYPSEALGVLRTLREAYSNPPFTPSGFVRDLTAKGFSGWLRRQRNAGTSSRGKRRAAGNRLVSALPYAWGREIAALFDGTECLLGPDRGPTGRPWVPCASRTPRSTCRRSFGMSPHTADAASQTITVTVGTRRRTTIHGKDFRVSPCSVPLRQSPTR